MALVPLSGCPWLEVGRSCRLVREPDDPGVVGGRPRGLARLAQALLDLAEPRLGPAGDGHLAGTDDLLDAERPQELDDALDLRLLPGELQRIGCLLYTS